MISLKKKAEILNCSYCDFCIEGDDEFEMDIETVEVKEADMCRNCTMWEARGCVLDISILYNNICTLHKRKVDKEK